MDYYFYNMIISVPDTEKSVLRYVGNYIRKNNISPYNYFSNSKCYYCNNNAVFRLTLNGNVISYIEPYGKSCKIKGCYSKVLNPCSKEFLKNCKCMSDCEIELFLKSKSKKGVITKKESGHFDDISNNPFSKEFWIKHKNMSEEEAHQTLVSRSKKGVTTKKENGHFDDISNNPFSKEFWIKHKNMSEEEAQYKVNSRNHWCKESSNINPAKIEYWHNKYGIDLGNELRDNMSNKISYSLSLKGQIEKYGVEEGTRRYKHRITRTSGFTNIKSKTAEHFFDELLDILICQKIDTSMVEYSKNKELMLYDTTNNTKYFYDFHLNGIIIEYNGDMWHPRLERIGETEFNKWKNPFKNQSHKSAYDVQNRDLSKIECAKQHGYYIIEVWDSEVRINRDEILNYCLKVYNEISKKIG